jgi:hypothetical protein
MVIQRGLFGLNNRINVMELKEILREIRNKPTVPLWPHAGRALGISRGATYQAAANGQIDILEIGRRKLAISATLRRRLGLDAEVEAA